MPAFGVLQDDALTGARASLIENSSQTLNSHCAAARAFLGSARLENGRTARACAAPVRAATPCMAHCVLAGRPPAHT